MKLKALLLSLVLVVSMAVSAGPMMDSIHNFLDPLWKFGEGYPDFVFPGVIPSLLFYGLLLFGLNYWIMNGFTNPGPKRLSSKIATICTLIFITLLFLTSSTTYSSIIVDCSGGRCGEIALSWTILIGSPFILFLWLIDNKRYKQAIKVFYFVLVLIGGYYFVYSNTSDKIKFHNYPLLKNQYANKSAASISRWNGIHNLDEDEVLITERERWRRALGSPEAYKTLAKANLKAAKQGSAYDQLMIGRSYIRGLGVKKDDKQAISWLTKAAKQGSVEAQSLITGLMYDLVVNRSKKEYYEQAVKWLTKAAEEGDLTAQEALDKIALENTN